MAGTAKPSREVELRALRGMLSDDELEAVHAYWLEQGVDPELESIADDSLISVLREAEGGLAELGRLDSAFERLADEVAQRTGEIRAELRQSADGRTSDESTAPPEVTADAKDSIEIAPETTRTIHPAASSAPIAAASVGAAPVAAATEATFLSNPNTGDDGPPQLTQRDGRLATPTEAELVPGLQLGAYRIVKRLGQGGMGSVFLAEHIRMERLVALKTLSPKLVRDAQAIKRFHREVKAAAKLSHPNIVTAYDADEARGLQMLVMEYVDGTDLAVRVRKNGPLPVAAAIDAVLQAARGLEFAHAKGVVHRDIKPANLLVDEAGVVKVLDMGLARIGEVEESPTDGLTSTGTIMGTAEFMAPEQALDTRTADARADIYSLGCTLYFLLTGKAPFQGDTVMKILLAHRDGSVPRAGDVRGDVPDAVDDLFARMVAKKVDDRFQTMTEVIAALEALRGEAVLNPQGGGVSLSSTGSFSSASRMMSPTRSDSLLALAAAVESAPRTQAAAPPAKTNTRRWWMAAAGGVAFLAGLMIVLTTREGKLILDLDQEDTQVEVIDDEGNVEVSRPGEKGILKIGIDPGKHRLKVRKAGFTLYTSDEFEIGWGGKKALTVKLKPLEKPVVSTAKPAVSKPSSAPKKVGKPIDLLALVELPRDSDHYRNEFHGEWKWEGKSLVGPDAPKKQGRMDIPYEVPPEFELVAEVEQVAAGNDGCALVVPVDGHPVEVAFHLFGPPVCGLSFIDGKSANENESATPGAVFQAGERHTLRVVVGKRSVNASVDGREVIAWEGNPRRLSTNWQPRSPRYVGLFSAWTSITFHRVELQELSGVVGSAPKGKPSGGAAPSGSTTIAWDTPEFRAWLEAVKDLPARKLIDAVSKKLVELNPGFDGRMSHDFRYDPGYEPVIENGRVVEIGLRTHIVSNLAPLRAFGKLRGLTCLGESVQNIQSTALVDLSPLRGLGLEQFSGRFNRRLADVSPIVGPELRVLYMTETPFKDLTQLRGLKLRDLEVMSSGVSDLSALAGMPLERLCVDRAYGTGSIRDLTPLRGMPLSYLSLRGHTGVTDLSPLAGMNFTRLDCHNTGVESLEPLRGSKIDKLELAKTPISDFSPLAGMPLKVLDLGETAIADLSPLRGAPLRELILNACTRFTDSSPLADLPLTTLWIEYSPARDEQVLRGIKSLSTINGKPVAEFWKEAAAMSANASRPAPKPGEWDTPEFRQWLADVKDLPAAKLLEAVSKKMAELNPGFEGKLAHSWNDVPGKTPVIQRGKVIEVGYISAHVTTIAPFRAFGTLRGVACLGPSEGTIRGELVDLSPLRGMEIERFCADRNSHLRDVSPVVSPRLKELQVSETKVTDLTPLRGSSLSKLEVNVCDIRDLQPLKGMPLETLFLCYFGPGPGVTDLTPLAGMPLKQLSLRGEKELVDLSGLAGLPLEYLDLLDTGVESLEPLRDMRTLKALILSSPRVSDLSPLKGLPLTKFECKCPKVSDLSPLSGLPLREVRIEFNAQRDTDWLRSLKTLERINGKPVAEFWKEVAAMSATPPKPGTEKNEWDTPEFRRWLAEVKDLPAEKLLEAVSKKMVELNPGFDGKLSHGRADLPGGVTRIERGKVVEVGFFSSNVRNVAPLRAFGKLKGLTCAGSPNPALQTWLLLDLTPLRGMEIERFCANWNRGLVDYSPVVGPRLKELIATDTRITDLKPLAGLSLRRLEVNYNGVTDIGPLAGMPLEDLGISGQTGNKNPGLTDLSVLKGMPLKKLFMAQISGLKDLSFLAGMSLEILSVKSTEIESLEPLRGMPLEYLDLEKTRVRDLSPLQDMPLQHLDLVGCDQLRDLSVLRGMALQELSLSFDADRDTELLRSLVTLKLINRKPVDEFWRKVDAK
jgi:serine/threonine protein kinase/Leucine-rich repeat (LRR) protein